MALGIFEKDAQYTSLRKKVMQGSMSVRAPSTPAHAEVPKRQDVEMYLYSNGFLKPGKKKASSCCIRCCPQNAPLVQNIQKK